MTLDVAPTPAALPPADSDPVVVYRPNPRQHAFHAKVHERRWYCGGYGSGKTTADVLEAFRFSAYVHPGEAGIMAAPTYPLLMSVLFEEWRRWVPQGWWELKRDPLKGPFLRCANGSTIWLRSASNPWSNEGLNAAWLVFDEVTRVRDRAAYDVLVARVRRGIPGRLLPVVLSGPPFGPRHWTAVEFGRGPDAGHTGDQLAWQDARHAVIRARTRDNPHLPPGYEEGLRARPGATDAWARRFLDAEFVGAEGMIYERFSRDTHVVTDAQTPQHFRRIVVGVDWGFVHFGVMVVVGQTGLGDMYVLHEEAHKGVLVDDTGWLRIADELRKRFRVESFTADPSEPGNITALRRRLGGNPVVRNADNDMGEGIRRVGAALGRPAGTGRLLVHQRCTQTIAEFEGYSRQQVRGEITERPQEHDDDCMDALRYAVMALTH